MAQQPKQRSLICEPSRSGFIAGTDEAGRGALAGPVVAAAVILPASWQLPYLNDSKKLSASRRETLAHAIREQAVAFGFGIIWPAMIDKINILQASLLAMSHATTRLRLPVSQLFIDGNQQIPSQYFIKKKKISFTRNR